MIYVEYNTDNNNKLDDLMIMGREKRRSKIYKSFVGSNIMNGRREGIPYMGGTGIFKSSRI